MYEYLCPQCEIKFESLHKPRKYCSLRCAADARTEQVRKKETKICRVCQIEKNRSEFSFKSKEKGSLRFECKKCHLIKLKNKPEEWKKKEKIRGRIKSRVKAGLDPHFEGKYPNTPPRNVNIRWKDANGYIQIYRPNHPNSRETGLIVEHRWIMSEYLGRPLFKKENVHHKNGVKDDNRYINLELWTTAQPSGQRVEDKIKWCIEFLEQYASEKLAR
jgi:hypothetical protein